MDGGLSFIIITVSKIGLAFGTAIGFSSSFNWFHQFQNKASKNGGNKRVIYKDSDVRERLHNIKQ